MAHVFARQFQSGFVVSYSAERDVYVRMLGIEMRDGQPFQFRSEVLLHSRHEIAGQPIKIESLSEFRRYDQFPKPRIALTLPTLQFFGGLCRSIHFAVHVVPKLTQNGSAGTLAGYVSPVSPP